MNHLTANTDAYFNSKVVKHYAEYSSELQLPEKKILELLMPELSQMRMLDIGVGGGRTTPFFAPYVKTYVGIDFSDGMINACKKKFNAVLPTAQFLTMDVRALSEYPDNAFDLILFSFNGLDNITPLQRELALKEIRRICRPGGYFCFSSHNIQSLPEFFSIRFRWHLPKFFRSLFSRNKLIAQNKEQISRMHVADHLIIFDDVYDFGLYTYYSRPKDQITQLENSGFLNVRLFSLKDGEEISRPELYTNEKGSWIYYLCQ